jgi:hypothetical protein
MEQNTIHTKSINNAISAYFMLFISSLFLFNKKNEYINNDFVKSHTKVAFLIHLSFLLTYVIFISFSFLKSISILNYNLNYILTSTIFTFLFITLLYWIYKSSKQEIFKIWDIFKIWEIENIVDVNWDWILDEKDKLTLILSYIPFIWYITWWENYKEKNISNIIKLNSIVTLILSLIYISWNKNIVLLFWLFYIIFAVFSSLNIIAREKIIWLNLDFIPTFSEILVIIKAFVIYLYNYITKKDFIWIKSLKNNYIDKYKKEEIESNKILNKFPETKLHNILIYIPFINLISFFSRNSNKKIHIINWIMITVFFIIFIILDFYNYIPNSSYILLLFPIFFWFWFINSRPSYKIPIIYDLFKILNSIKDIFKKTKKTFKEKQAEEHSEIIKVWNIKK